MSDLDEMILFETAYDILLNDSGKWKERREDDEFKRANTGMCFYLYVIKSPLNPTP